MKGFLYRESVLSRKEIAAVFFLYGIVLILNILIILSTQFGNLATHEDVDNIRQTVGMLYYTETLILFCAALTFIKTIALDAKNGWNNFACTLPGGFRKLVAAKYVAVYCTAIAAFILGIFTAVLVSSVSHEPLTTQNLVVLLLMFAGVCLMLSLILPISYFVKDSNKLTTILVLPGFCIFMGFMYSVSKIEDEQELIRIFMNIYDKAKNILNKYWILFLMISVLICAGSYYLSVFIMEKGGEKERVRSVKKRNL